MDALFHDFGGASFQSSGGDPFVQFGYERRIGFMQGLMAFRTAKDFQKVFVGAHKFMDLRAAS
jgi:hypothetical protein